MKVLLVTLFSLTLICTVVFGHHLNGEPHDDDDHKEDHHSKKPTPIQEILPYNLEFAYKFYSYLATKYPDKNLFFSPISISIAFCMLSLGAKGETLSQIQEGLGFNISAISTEDIHKGFQQLQHILNAPHGDLQLNIANALFVDKETHLLQKFLDDVKNFYESEIISTNFHKPVEAKNQINSYVAKKTNDKIKDLLDNIDPQTVLILLNAIHFSGTWKYAFDETHTKERDFHVNERTVVKVPMMTTHGDYLMAYVKDIGYVVDVPYNGNVSTIFIVPDEGKLHDVEKTLQNVSLQTYTKLMKLRQIRLSVPKFSVSATLDLKEELSELGIKDVFSGHADLSGITGSPLMVSKAVHKAVLHMDEKGAEAAAATAIGVVKLSLPPHVDVNRPFIVTILDKTHYTTLFTGRVFKPEI